MERMTDNNVFETLYIYDKKDRARSWQVSTEGSDVTVTHGLVDGKKTVKVTTSKPKNAGKSNATTGPEQAVKDAQSKWNAQVNRDDYNVNIESAGRQLRPMLALDYKNVKHRLNWYSERTVVQPKLDGLRLVTGHREVNGDPTKPIEMLTRKGETYDLPHLLDHCKVLLGAINGALPPDAKILALDGEVYVHGMPLGKIVSRARKFTEDTQQLEYHLFDLVIQDMPFSQRIRLLQHVMAKHPHPKFQFVPVTVAKNEAEMKQFHGEFLADGYEGCMIRPGNGLYEICTRSEYLFKYKEFFDKECKIVGVFEDANGNAMLECLWDHNDPTSRFNSSPKRTHAERKAMLEDETLVGSWVTIKYQDVSFATHKGGLPTFNVGLGIRECDDEGNALI